MRVAMNEIIRQEREKWSSASFRIGGERFEPGEIEAILGFSATSFKLKGERLSPRLTMTRRNSVWVLKCPLSDQLPLQEHLEWLLNVLEPKLDAISGLKQKHKIDLFCGFSSENGQGGFTLSPSILTRLSNLGISLVLDLYPREPIVEMHSTAEERGE
jgi:hypothetical protein